MKKVFSDIAKYPGVASILFLLTISSCNLHKEYQQQFSRDDLYRGIETSDTTSLADIPWNEVFTDTVLQGLISEGLTANLDLKIAVANIQRAEANFLQAKGALLPGLDVAGSASFSKLANTISVASGFAQQQYQLYGSASWEVDIWGKLRSAKRSALANVLASEAYRRAVQTRLIADIANNYYTLLALDKQLEITEQTVEFREEYVETVEFLKNAATVTGADLMQSRANQFSAEVMVPDLKQAIREVENALSILLGKSPDEINRTALEAQNPRELLDTGVPSLLLSNRPDVQQAEFEVRSAFEMVNSARAYFYPSLTLTGASGFAAQDISELFNPTSVFGNIAGGLLQPVFNQNVNKARLQVNIANREEAYAIYEQTLLSAGEEVSNALYAYDMAEQKISVRQNQLEALENAVDYNQELLQYGSANYVDVLTSQQNLLSAQLSGVEDQLQKLQAIVELYRALGGGWE
ncbi:MAG: efflux transporter outer membrane subunit [Cyclobacteriaceae bacterium]